MLNEELLEFLKEFFSTSDLNKLHETYGGGSIFLSPIIGVASGNDPIFKKFKEVVGPEHLTPIEMWLSSGQDSISPSKLRIVSIVFPFSDEIRKGSRKAIQLSRIILPAEIYSMGRNYANAFKAETLRQTKKFLIKRGYKTVAGMLSESFSIILKDGFHSTWSERHIAFATGLGTFSLHEALITDLGCNIRLASIITNAPFKVSSRKTDDPYKNCLFYGKGICRECEKRCPGKAITEDGHDKKKCYEYGQKIARKMIQRIGPVLKPHKRRVNGKLRPEVYPVGCAFCQFDVPCMDKNPMAR
jgi:epoxyqueuosine reductase QueG